jgi:hypothetical protein
VASSTPRSARVISGGVRADRVGGNLMGLQMRGDCLQVATASWDSDAVLTRHDESRSCHFDSNLTLEGTLERPRQGVNNYGAELDLYQLNRRAARARMKLASCPTPSSIQLDRKARCSENTLRARLKIEWRENLPLLGVRVDG